MEQIKAMVHGMLTTTSSTRDCDYRLYMEILFKYNSDGISALTLMRQMKSGVLPSFESVSRARRQLQQHFVELRGEKWEKRQGILQDIKKQELGYESVELFKP